MKVLSEKTIKATYVILMILTQLDVQKLIVLLSLITKSSENLGRNKLSNKRKVYIHH
jgi:hypothetical protein